MNTHCSNIATGRSKADSKSYKKHLGFKENAIDHTTLMIQPTWQSGTQNIYDELQISSLSSLLLKSFTSLFIICSYKKTVIYIINNYQDIYKIHDISII